MAEACHTMDEQGKNGKTSEWPNRQVLGGVREKRGKLASSLLLKECKADLREADLKDRCGKAHRDHQLA